MTPKKILIVEDELITQRYIKITLKKMGVENFESAMSAIEAIQLLKESSFNMILMDINIKGQIDGITLAKSILQDINIPIIFISAYNDDATIDEILEFSSDGFISKPFTSKDLEITIKMSYKNFVNRNQIQNSKVTNRDIILNNEYTFSLKKIILYHNNREIELTLNQLKLIEALVENINNTVSIEQLKSIIWYEKNMSDSTLRTLIYSIRKLAPTLNIISHSKIGYCIKNR